MNNSTFTLAKFVVFLSTLIFVSNFPAFVLALRVGIIPGHFLVIGILVMLFTALLMGHLLRINIDTTRYLVWYGALLLYCLFSLLLIANEDTAIGAYMSMLYAAALSTSFVLLAQNRELVRLAGIAIVIATVIAAGVSFVEFINPDFNVLQDRMFDGKQQIGKVGRSGGLHSNPNANASTMVLGLFIGQLFIPKPYRLPFALFVGAAVFTTVSRGGMTLWLLATVASFMIGIYSAGRLLPKLAGLALATILVGLLVSGKIPEILVALGLDEYMSPGMLSRLSVSFTDIDSGSNEGRLEIAREAFELYLAHPLFGAGLGASEALGTWSLGSHNLFLKMGAELGTFGVLLLLALSLVAVLSGSLVSTVFTALFFVMCLVDHNTLERSAVSILLPMGVFLAAGYQAGHVRHGRRRRRRRRSHHRHTGEHRYSSSPYSTHH